MGISQSIKGGKKMDTNKRKTLTINMQRFPGYLILGIAVLSLLFLSSCATNKASRVTTVAQTQTTQKLAVTNLSKDQLLKKIRMAMTNFQYERVIELSYLNKNSEVRYYRALAYFSMMLNTSKYSQSSRNTFGGSAESLLNNVIRSRVRSDLLARALIWRGILLDTRYTSLKNKRRAIGSFFVIQSDPRLKKGSYYDDSLLYSGDVYSKMGWYVQARSFYRRLSRLSPNNITYDYIDNAFYSPQKAARQGLARLDDYVQGVHLNYQPTN